MRPLPCLLLLLLCLLAWRGGAQNSQQSVQQNSQENVQKNAQQNVLPEHIRIAANTLKNQVAVDFSLDESGLPEAAPKPIVLGPASLRTKLIDTPLYDLIWADLQTCFVITDSGRLYRSEDAGASWNPILGELQGREGSRGATALDPKTGAPVSPLVEAVMVSNADPNFIFVDGLGHRNWVSRDMGLTYAPVRDMDIRNIQMHPTRPEWMLAQTLSAGCADSERARGGGRLGGVGCFYVLWVSRDFGSSWKHLADYVDAADWSPEVYARGSADPSGPPHEYPEGFREETVYALLVEDDDSGGHQFHKDRTLETHLFASADWFESSRRLASHVVSLLSATNRYVFLVTRDPAREGLHLLVSRERDPLLSALRHPLRPVFHEARFPFPPETASGFVVLESLASAVLVHVSDSRLGDSGAGTVYTSDWTGVDFSLSLPMSLLGADENHGFHEVLGLEGIFFANVVDRSALKAAPSSGAGSRGAGRLARAGRSGRSGARTEVRGRQQTVVTFDQGSRWHFLQAPPRDSLGREPACARLERCYLHLHGSPEFGPVYSVESAIGVILATGNVGEFLSHDPSQVNTYLSRDAGLTWVELRKGSRIYEISDNGGLIILADHIEPTNLVEFSWDYGRSWTPLKISDALLRVDNIVTDPASFSQQFLVLAQSLQGSAGFLIHVDLDLVHPRLCTGYDLPDRPESDYETFTPNDGRQTGCLLGHTAVYTRRRAEAACTNPEEQAPAVFLQDCACSEADFQCDFGFERHSSGACVPSAEQPEFLPMEEEEIARQCARAQQTHYRISRGYRRVPGNSCLGGERWEGLELPCPRPWVSRGHAGALVLWALLLAAGGIGLVLADRRWGWWAQLSFYLWELSGGYLDLGFLARRGPGAQGQGQDEAGSFWKRAYVAVGQARSRHLADDSSLGGKGFEDVPEGALDPSLLEQGARSTPSSVSEKEERKARKKAKKAKRSEKQQRERREEPFPAAGGALSVQAELQGEDPAPEEDADDSYVISPLPQLPQILEPKNVPKLDDLLE